MNEELKQKLIDSLESTEAFVAEQAPLVAQEALYYGKLQGAFNIITVLVALVICVMLCMSFLRSYQENWHEDHWAAFSTVSGICALFALAGLGFELMNNLQPWIAPKLYLLRVIGETL